MQVQISTRNNGFLIGLSVCLTLLSCSLPRESGKSSPQDMSSEGYSYPHDKKWGTGHVSFLALNAKDSNGELSHTQESCVSCHENLKIKAKYLNNVSCGMKSAYRSRRLLWRGISQRPVSSPSSLIRARCP